MCGIEIPPGSGNTNLLSKNRLVLQAEIVRDKPLEAS